MATHSRGSNFREAFKREPLNVTRIRHNVLFGAMVSLFESCGVSQQHARLIAKVIMYSDLRGNDTHGFSTLMPKYLSELRTKKLNPVPLIEATRTSSVISIVNCDNAPGTVAMTVACELAVERAKQSGISAVFVRNSGHSGALGYYTLSAAKKGMFCLALAAGYGLMVPPRSIEPLLGTNPFSFAVPTLKNPPLVFDASTTAICGNRIKLAKIRNLDLADDWFSAASEFTNRRSYDETNLPALSPVGIGEDFGSHKAFGFAILAEILGNLLFKEFVAPGANKPQIGHFILVIDPLKLDNFRSDVDFLLSTILKLEPETASMRVLYPGLRSFETAQSRFMSGIPIERVTETWLEKELGSIGLEINGKWPVEDIQLEDFT